MRSSPARMRRRTRLATTIPTTRSRRTAPLWAARPVPARHVPDLWAAGHQRREDPERDPRPTWVDTVTYTFVVSRTPRDSEETVVVSRPKVRLRHLVRSQAERRQMVTEKLDLTPETSRPTPARMSWPSGMATHSTTWCNSDPAPTRSEPAPPTQDEADVDVLHPGDPRRSRRRTPPMTQRRRHAVRPTRSR